MYGKFAGFGDFIFHYDAYIDGGVGVIRTKPIPVIDPDNRSFNWNTLVNFDVGIGLRIFFNRWLAAVLEVRDIMYFEKIENIKVAQGQPVTAGHGRVREQPVEPGHLVRPEHALHQRRPVASRALAVSADFLRIHVAEMRTETRTAMKRRFVRTVLAALAVAAGLSAAGAADAQELQLTGPLKGAPAVRHLRLYRQGRFEIAPSAVVLAARRVSADDPRRRARELQHHGLARDRRLGRRRRRQLDDRPDRQDRRDGAARSR